MAKAGALKGVANVRFGSLADMCGANPDVRFTPKSGHLGSRLECPLCANSLPFGITCVVPQPPE